MTTPQDPFASGGDDRPGDSSQPGFGQPPYGQQPGYGQQPYGQPAYGGGGYAAPRSGTNGLAIGALIAAFFCAPAGIIMGVIARNQVKQSGQGGSGLALAGIIIGIVSIVFGVLIFGAALTTGVSTGP